MLKLFKISFLVFFLFLISCSKNEKQVSIIVEDDLEFQMIDAYKEGYKELEKGDVIYAAKKFNEAELLYPQSEWAPKAVLLAAYSFYSQDYYPRAIAEIERFIRKYPKHKKQLMEIGKMVSNSRLMARAHYPSDTKLGEKIGELLFLNLK